MANKIKQRLDNIISELQESEYFLERAHDRVPEVDKEGQDKVQEAIDAHEEAIQYFKDKREDMPIKEVDTEEVALELEGE